MFYTNYQDSVHSYRYHYLLSFDYKLYRLYFHPSLATASTNPVASLSAYLKSRRARWPFTLVMVRFQIKLYRHQHIRTNLSGLLTPHQLYFYAQDVGEILCLRKPFEWAAKKADCLYGQVCFDPIRQHVPLVRLDTLQSSIERNYTSNYVHLKRLLQGKDLVHYEGFHKEKHVLKACLCTSDEGVSLVEWAVTEMYLLANALPSLPEPPDPCDTTWIEPPLVLSITETGESSHDPEIPVYTTEPPKSRPAITEIWSSHDLETPVYTTEPPETWDRFHHDPETPVYTDLQTMPPLGALMLPETWPSHDPETRVYTDLHTMSPWNKPAITEICPSPVYTDLQTVPPETVNLLNIRQITVTSDFTHLSSMLPLLHQTDVENVISECTSSVKIFDE